MYVRSTSKLLLVKYRLEQTRNKWVTLDPIRQQYKDVHNRPLLLVNMLRWVLSAVQCSTIVFDELCNTDALRFVGLTYNKRLPWP